MTHHRRGLRRQLVRAGLTGDDAGRLVQQLVDDWRQADLDAADRAMLDYAEQLTLRPGDVTASHVATLRRAGLDDRAIHDLCAIIAYYAFANRIADGLGIELESAD